MQSRQRVGTRMQAKALFLTTALFCGAANAEFYTGNDLLNRMNGESAAERNVALGYVMGVSDVLLHVNHCPPNEVTSGQMRDVVRNYLTNVPAERHFSADSLVAKVLKIAWPCANNQRRGQAL